MKFILKAVLLPLTAILALAACSDDEPAPVVPTLKLIPPSNVPATIAVNIAQDGTTGTVLFTDGKNAAVTIALETNQPAWRYSIGQSDEHFRVVQDESSITIFARENETSGPLEAKIILRAGSSENYAQCELSVTQNVAASDGDPVIYTSAAAQYWDDALGTGLGMYYIFLCEGVTVDPADPMPQGGPGSMVSIELYTPYPETPEMPIPAGVYKFTPEGQEPGRFSFTGGNWDGEETGTFSITVDAEGSMTEVAVIGGEFTIEYVDYKYSITGKFDLEGSNKPLEFKYAGDMEIYNAMNPEGEMPEEFEGTFYYAEASYEGDFYDSGMGSLMVSLIDKDDPEMLPYNRLVLDVNIPLAGSKSDIDFASGTYNIAQKGVYNKSFTFNPGAVTEETLEGSYWCQHDSQDGWHPTAVAGGTVTVSKSGSVYTVAAKVTLDDGTEIEGTYRGPMEIYDNSTLSLLDRDVTLNGLNAGTLDFYGTLAYVSENYNWVMTLYSESNPGTAVILEFMSAPGSLTEAPSGTYNPMPAIDNQYLLPFNYIPGHLSGSGNIVGCWYMENNKGIAPLVDGTFVIGRNGSNYTVTFDMKDDYGYSGGPHTVKGSFSGALQYNDFSEGWHTARPARPMQQGVPVKGHFRRAA